MLQEILTRAILRNQPSLTAQRPNPPLDHRQRLRRGDAEKAQAPAGQPGVPGAAGAPEALEPVADTLDVVALDNHVAATNRGAGDGAAAAILEQGGSCKCAIGIVK